MICYLSAASLEGSKTRANASPLVFHCAWTGLLAKAVSFFAKIPKFQAVSIFSCEVNEWLRYLELPVSLHSALQHGAVDDSEVRCLWFLEQVPLKHMAVVVPPKFGF